MDKIKNKLVMFLGITIFIWSVLYLLGAFDYIGVYLAPAQHAAIFFGIVLWLLFLTIPARKGGRPGKWFDWILIIMSIVPCGYVFWFYKLWTAHGSFTPQNYELLFSLLLLITLFEALRRSMGIFLSIILAFFILQPLLSAYLPGILSGRGYSFQRVLSMVYFSPPSGIFSLPLNIAATIIFAFLLFGEILLGTGGGKVLIDLATTITGRFRGGSAKSAVVASGLFGSISGSPAANVALTGTFTIPLMKSQGFSPVFSGAVEATASTGGTVLPPIMGAVAFIMAEWLGVPYAKIALMGFLPAIILYAGLLIQVDANAVKNRLQRFSSSEIPSLVEVLKRGWVFLIPVAVLIFCLFFLKMDAEEAALWGTLCILVLTTAKKTFRLSLRKLAVAMTDTAKSSIVVAVACAMAGVIMASVETTGFTVSITNYFVEIAGENLFLMLILSAVASFIFGMGIGSIASYIFVVILVAPALSAFGQPEVIIHFFVFWIAMAAFITPPFCVSAFVAASISHSSMMRTGFRAVGLGIGFIYIPFFFVYNPGLLLQGSLVEIVVAGICAAIGISCMAFAIEGYFIRQLNWGVRGILIVSAILMVFPVSWIRLLALLLISLVFLWLITTTGKLQLNYKALKAKFNNKQKRPGSFLN